MNDPTTIRRLYGRRQGHKLRQGQAALVEDMLPALSVPEDGPLDAMRLFGDDRPLQVEIGFGAGEHLRVRPRRRPAPLYRLRAVPERRGRRAGPYP